MDSTVGMALNFCSFVMINVTIELLMKLKKCYHLSLWLASCFLAHLHCKSRKNYKFWQHLSCVL